MSIFVYRFLRKTEALKILIGLLFIYATYYIADTVGFTTTAFLLNKASVIFTFAIVLIFQPELRMALRKLGDFTQLKTKEEEKSVIASVEEAAFSLSKQKIGALIIFDPHHSLISQVDNAVPIDAKVTAELIETIFYPNTRLHDGALIIQQDKIAYAGCKLPLKGHKREEYKDIGTRHLAAIENAETFGISAVVVSEETGRVSVVTENGMTRIKNTTMFKDFFYEEKQEKSWLAKILKK